MSITRINTNFDAMFARNQLQKLEMSISKSTTRLSTGNKITTSGDDPAAVPKIAAATAQLRGNMAAQQNIQETIQFTKYTDTAMRTIQDKLLTMRDIAMQQANGATLSNTQRASLASEWLNIRATITNTAALAGYQWNGKQVLAGFSAYKAQIGPNKVDRLSFASVNSINATTLNIAATCSTAASAIGCISGLDTGLSTLGTALSNQGMRIQLLELELDNQFNMETANASTLATLGDADMAQEIAALASNQILAQASTAMLGQANMQAKLLVGLLG